MKGFVDLIQCCLSNLRGRLQALIRKAIAVVCVLQRGAEHLALSPRAGSSYLDFRTTYARNSTPGGHFSLVHIKTVFE